MRAPFILIASALTVGCNFFQGKNDPKEITLEELKDQFSSPGPYPIGDFLVTDTLRSGSDTVWMGGSTCEGYFYFSYATLGLPPRTGFKIQLQTLANDGKDTSFFRSQFASQRVSAIFRFPRQQPACAMICVCDRYINVESLVLQPE